MRTHGVPYLIRCGNDNHTAGRRMYAHTALLPPQLADVPSRLDGTNQSRATLPHGWTMIKPKKTAQSTQARGTPAPTPATKRRSRVASNISTTPRLEDTPRDKEETNVPPKTRIRLPRSAEAEAEAHKAKRKARKQARGAYNQEKKGESKN